MEKSFRELAGRTTADETVKTTYRELTARGISTRTAATLVGLPRATATRKPQAIRLPAVAVLLGEPTFFAWRAPRIALIWRRSRFMRRCSTQASICTIDRVLRDNRRVKERCSQAWHSARAIPKLIATIPGDIIPWDITELPGLIKGDGLVMVFEPIAVFMT